MSLRSYVPQSRPLVAAVLTGLFGALAAAGTMAQPRASFVRLRGHVPRLAARRAAAVPAGEPIHLQLTLPLRNSGELDQLLTRQYDPSDPLYGQYLTPEQFAERFAPSEAQYDAVTRFAQANGLTVTGRHPNRTILDVTGPAGAVESAFNTRLSRFQATDGRIFRAPEVDPAIPTALAGTLSGVVGLDDLNVRHPNHRVRGSAAAGGGSRSGHGQVSPQVNPIGSGPNGGLSPSDIKAAYNLKSIPEDGTGQTLALYELDGYDATDVTAYENQFGLPHVTLQNILVDNFSGAAGQDAIEVTLDIELQIALAPGISKILVYEATNPDGSLDCYNKIATDNLAKSISVSWGLAENQISLSEMTAESNIYKQMAAQGQTIFVSSGDDGAYTDKKTLTVSDPASQPYVTSVGGTQLATNGPGGSWKSETSWNDGTQPGDSGGGGGISAVWPIPTYQVNVVGGATTKGSTTMRNVPDVSLDAEPNTGYAIYIGGQWTIVGGTSCAAPLWAAYAALVNQRRASQIRPVLGFANPLIYQVGLAHGTTSFHDIADGSTNLFYPAVAGYDCSTGWGTFNGASLMPDLVEGIPTKFSIQGTVQLAGAPLPGVTVAVTDAQAVTAADGTYSLNNLKAGSYTVTPTLSGYAFTPSSRQVTVGPSVQGVNFTAAVIPTFTIQGQVTENLQPLAGVTVAAGGKTATTMTDGTYTLSGVVAGTYTVTATKTAYAFDPASQPVTVGPNATGVNFKATRVAFTIAGVVSADGSPLQGATVRNGNQSVTTDATGAYSFQSLPAGPYTVNVSKDNYNFIPSRQTVNVGPDQTQVNFNGTLRTYRIAGRVTTGTVGAGGVTVFAGTLSTTTDGGGNFSFTGLNAGSYTVTCFAAKQSISPAKQAVTVGPDATNVNFAAVPLLDIRGQVTLKGVGLAGVVVTAGGKSTVTDGKGNYLVPNLPAGIYAVTPSLASYQFTPGSSTVNLTSSLSNVNFAATQLAQLKSFTLSKTTVTAGKSVTGTLTLTVPATQDVNVNLFCSDPTAARVPGSVRIPKGKSSATFTVTTPNVRFGNVVSIQASAGGVVIPLSLTITAAK